ncbi:MAG: tyrosine-protein phosphatase [Actinomycetota bacterium]|nr:tyrosine-protein phosphatase [Actinomycetota bacterium]
MDTYVTRVAVEPAEPGSLTVSWELDGEPAAVDIGVGPTPDAIDHTHTVTVKPPATSARLDGLAPGRHYVSVGTTGSATALIAAERRIPFEGLQNFRDLGGYRADGGHTRWGLVFRSDGLHKLTGTDLIAFERLGIRVVYDLRNETERSDHPNPVASIHLPVVGRPPGAVSPLAEPTEVRSTADGERLLRDMYVGMLAHSAPLFGRILGGLVEDDGMPALFHCHAGKDRTGMTAALLLLALGVDAEDILDDYELTRRYRLFEHQQDSYENMLANGLPHEAALGVLGGPRWTMAAALDDVDSTHGGIEAYLTGPAGMTAVQLDALRDRLITP